MTPDQYHQLALRTESQPKDTEVSVRAVLQLHDGAQQVMKAGRLLDGIKRHLFYGSELPGKLPLWAKAMSGAYKQERTLSRRDHRLLHGMLGMATEVGELIEQIAAHIDPRNRTFNLDPVHVMEECGDLLWYIAVALDSCDYTMTQAMERNIAKLRARFPKAFDATGAVERDLKAERAELERRDALTDKGYGPDTVVAQALRAEQAVYLAAVKVFEDLEHRGLIAGNGHHIAQALAMQAKAIAIDRWRG